MDIREKILLGIAIFALAGIMVPISANATHDENHKSKLMILGCSGAGCSIWIDKNNDGICESNELTRQIMKIERVRVLIELGVIGVCSN